MDGSDREDREVMAGWLGCINEVIVFDWCGVFQYVIGDNGKYYVDPKFVHKFTVDNNV